MGDSGNIGKNHQISRLQLGETSEMGREMLLLHILEHGDLSGQAKLYLTDAETVADQYLAGKGAAYLEALNWQYGLPVDSFYTVYKPLLAGLVTSCVATELSIHVCLRAFQTCCTFSQSLHLQSPVSFLVFPIQ